MITEVITIYAYITIFIWGLATTVYGLYLSRRNNETFNKNIIKELKEIKELMRDGNKI